VHAAISRCSTLDASYRMILMPDAIQDQLMSSHGSLVVTARSDTPEIGCVRRV